MNSYLYGTNHNCFTIMNSTKTLISPVTGAERIISLDILRGVAVLGILLMNIQSFSMIGAAYINPTAYGDLTSINRMVWILSHLLANSKFMSIFSLLFGAGVILFTERAIEKGRKASAFHYRRMMWLLIFGFIHAYLIWYGDILVAYSLCAFLVYLFRNKKPSTLLTLGLVIFFVKHSRKGWSGTSESSGLLQAVGCQHVGAGP